MWIDLKEGDVVVASFGSPSNDEPVLLMLTPNGSRIRYVNLMTGERTESGKCSEKLIEGWILLPWEGT